MSIADIPPGLPQDSNVSLNSRVGVRRIGALCLDFVLLLLMQLWIYSAFGILSPWPLAGGSLAIPPVTPNAAWFTRDWFGEVLLVVVYFSLQEALFGTTLGKFIARLRVTDKQGQRPALGAILLRNVLRLIDLLPIISISLGAITFTIPYVIGGIIALISRHRQRLGDLVAGTLVVDAASIPFSSLSPHKARQRLVRLTALALLVAAWLGSVYLLQPSLLIRNAITIGPGISSYMIGSPTRNIDVVSYPLQWRSIDSPSPTIGGFSTVGRIEGSSLVCNATITMHWSFLIVGWRITHGEWKCHSEQPGKNGEYSVFQGMFDAPLP